LFSYRLLIRIVNSLQQVDTTVLGLPSEEAKKMPYIASMGIYVFKKEVLLKLLRYAAALRNCAVLRMWTVPFCSSSAQLGILQFSCAGDVDCGILPHLDC
jgi:hypothetical protein